MEENHAALTHQISRCGTAFSSDEKTGEIDSSAQQIA
jgi:hypothetical protein